MKETNKPRYFVTTIRIREAPRDIRCIGYYPFLRQARCLVQKNFESLCEAGYYQYAVIEKFGPGWYPYSHFQEWYSLLKRGAKRISQPKRFKKTCNFGIG